MTDIVEKLRAEWVADVNSCPQCGADDTDQTDGLMREAADEIERLRAMNDEARNEIERRCEEVRRLRVEAGYD